MVGNLWRTWNSWSLIGRIVCGLVIGTILALVVPGSEWIALLGTLFVSALKAVAPVLVFFLVISALCNATKSGAMKRIVVLYVIGTFIAGIVAVCASFLFPLQLTLQGVEAANKTAPSGVGEVLSNLLTNIVSNPVGSLTEANFLAILTWAILIGIALRAASDGTKRILADTADAVQKVVRWVIAFAPFGVLGLVYNAVTTSGIEIFTEYGELILILVGCMAIIAFITNPIMVYLNIHRNPFPLVFRCLKDSAITAFFTRSSAANIPINMELCRKLGLDKDNYSVSIPLGATVNMAGACVTITVMSMAAAQTLGIQVDFLTAVILCVLSAVSAAGASGVAGGSLLLIPVACSLLGVPTDIAMQMVGVGFIIGVIQDSCETALNSSSDALFTATAEYANWNKVGVEYQAGRDHEPVDADLLPAARIA
ncbi:serine/threonine transporter SstT [Curtanaerobium respiraculi]|uniref:serine/threonine transporter SstT n=1 Tax=Curtanaerobium respiraculi TaxID=2949669 RepID=UPI003D163DFF